MYFHGDCVFFKLSSNCYIKLGRIYDVLLFPIYNLVSSLQVAFLIYRPVMRLFKCQSSSDVFWPLDDVASPKASIAEKDSEQEDSSAKLVLDLGPSWKPIT